jgi:hypothetical protein
VRARSCGGYPIATVYTGQWKQWIVNPDTAARSQLTFATEAFRYLLGRGSTWTISDYRRAADGIGMLELRHALAVGSVRKFQARGERFSPISVPPTRSCRPPLPSMAQEA